MPSRAARLEAWLREKAPVRVEMSGFDELMALFAPVEEPELRHLLRESGAKLHPIVAGVDQSTLVALRQSLVDLANCYEKGDEATRRLARRIVITAKDHAKLAARNRRVALEKREQKEVMTAWMLTWLENPGIFPLWVELREKSGGSIRGDNE